MIKRLKPTQKLRVIINGISFYTTAKQVRNGIGDLYTPNAAVQKALDALEFQRHGDPCVGLAGTWEGMQVQINII